ncbi:type II CAAX prenyl endopeptidase Rce1 family protein [Ekhidna sp.]|uniref:CPBP family glutamic-type intramembrane protease n=1 Tax=Ekhidna sp. TaxID=2608089 RepID=UPI003BA96D07
MNFIARFKKVKSGFLNFWKYPQDYKYQGLSDVNRLKDILIIVFLELLILVPLAFIIDEMQKIGLLNFPDHKLMDMIDGMSIIRVLFIVVIMAPIIEEVLFRGFITFQRFYPVLFLIAILGALGKNKFKAMRIARRLWEICFPFLVIFSVLIFGLAHVWNFEELVSLWLIPIAVSPQLVAGLFLTYARVRYGLIWSMMLHATVNLTALALHYSIY